MEMTFHATTICAVRHNGTAAIAGDGQVTFGESVVMKQTAKKVRRLYRGQVVAGFAGSVADAITLFEKFEGKLEEHHGNLQRAAVELAKDWRQDRVLRKLEALMIVMDKTGMLLISGGGEIIEPDDDVLAIGSGGNFALSAGRALKRHAGHMEAKDIAREALQIASEVCVYTNSTLLWKSCKRAMQQHIAISGVEVFAMSKESMTPRQIVSELDKYIVGQKDAKKSVAVALRNRYRRSLLTDDERDEIVPKNILMIGPTGVGKTEIARRLAKLVHAPFVKVEATKFTEVGYVGRDVESMVRDLVETAIRMVKLERTEKVKDKAEEMANERIVQLLAPSAKGQKSQRNPFEMLFGGGNNDTQADEEDADEKDVSLKEKRRQVRFNLLSGKLEDETIEIDVEDAAPNMFDMFAGQGNDQMGMNMQEMFGNLMPKRTKRRKLSVKEARKVLTQEEAGKLIDMDDVIQESIRRAEQSGIIFIDEIDKVASQGRQSGPDVSREGVQRDILPIVEGSTIMTKYGPVKTDFVLFIAAGAFHIAKPSDLIPELQGRFPIRVELNSLSLDDFVSILTEPKNALTKQYVNLLRTEDLEIEFSPEAIREIAQIAASVNQNTENIGARRLHTILEKLLEDLSFEAPELTLDRMVITPQYVREKLAGIAQDRDLSQYIL